MAVPVKLNGIYRSREWTRSCRGDVPPERGQIESQEVGFLGESVLGAMAFSDSC